MPITITSKQEGFRRCGVPHSKEPTDYPDGHFSAEELVVLKAEPMLTVSATKTDKQPMNANNTIAAIKEAEDVATLDALVPETESRKTVLEAATAKRTELEATD